MKEELERSIKVLAGRASNAATVYDSANFAQAAKSLAEALVLLGLVAQSK